MKKLIFTITCVVFAMTCLGQNIIQVSGNQSNSQKQDDCPFRINGICSTEDIGGVMVEYKKHSDGYDLYAHFDNYNSFPVTVLLLFGYDDLDPKIITCVLPSSGHKEVKVSDGSTESYCKTEGMIVRKLSN